MLTQFSRIFTGRGLWPPARTKEEHKKVKRGRRAGGGETVRFQARRPEAAQEGDPEKRQVERNDPGMKGEARTARSITRPGQRRNVSCLTRRKIGARRPRPKKGR